MDFFEKKDNNDFFNCFKKKNKDRVLYNLSVDYKQKLCIGRYLFLKLKEVVMILFDVKKFNVFLFLVVKINVIFKLLLRNLL